MEDGFELTLHGLLRKRAEMAGQVNAMHEQMAVLLTGLDHLDAAIRIFNPAIDIEDMPERPVPPASAAFRGEVQRFLLQRLRASGEPMTTHDLTRELMDARNLNTADRVLFKLIATRTGHALTRLRGRGFIASERETKGALLTWRLSGKGGSGGALSGWRNGSG